MERNSCIKKQAKKVIFFFFPFDIIIKSPWVALNDCMFVCDEADRQTWPWVTMAPSTALNSFLPSPDPAQDSQLSKNVFNYFSF